MNRLPFAHPGAFVRTNLHTHTTTSDGVKSPAEVVAAYRDHGYGAVAITDHYLERYGWRITDVEGLGDDRIVVLRGAELHGDGHPRDGSLWHLVAVGLPTEFGPPEGGTEDGPTVAARAVAAGAWVAAAHPTWYGLNADGVRLLGTIHAVEVYNALCVYLNDRGDSWSVLDELTRGGTRLDAAAADDAHFSHDRDRFRAWVMVRTPERTPEAIVAALKAGHFYASTGPSIEQVELEGDLLTVACSPADRVYVTGPGPAAAQAYGVSLTTATLNVAAFARGRDLVRLTVVDAAGGRAWTNPFVLPDA